MKIVLYLLAACALWACARDGSNQSAPDTSPADIANAPELASHEVPLPAVPDSLKTSAERADYLLLHFWDAMDFNDTAQLADTLLLEQSFSNFIYLLPRVSGLEAMEAAVGQLTRRAAANPEATRRISEIADDYLYAVESPFQSETLYKIYLQQLLKQNPAGADRYRLILKEVQRNEPGTVAPDFKFGSTSLAQVASEGQYTMLVFYKNDCSDCASEIESLGRDAKLGALVADGIIKVVAVDTSDADGLIPLPQGWVGAHTSAPVEELYSIRRSPSIYLIDNNRKIVLKDKAYPVIAAKLFI